MAKIFFFPLLHLPSGHHRVADALISSLEERDAEIRCDKIDILSHVSRKAEEFITSFYLRWIHSHPTSYELVYRYYAGPTAATRPEHFQWYQDLVLWKMEKLIKEERPDLAVCTHSFPSSLLGRLKARGKLSLPVVNVYTDYFVNNVWAGKEADYHFVPDSLIKAELQRRGVPGANIFVTGIPVDACFEAKPATQVVPPYHVLVSGGSSGWGNIRSLLLAAQPDPRFRYSVLCGGNRDLFTEISSWGNDRIRPLAYIRSRTAMNDLYNRVDAVVTKPGGSTLSELLAKRIPIFLLNPLPGPEEVNSRHLVSQGLAYPLRLDASFQEQLLDTLASTWELQRLRARMDAYHQNATSDACETIMSLCAGRRYLEV